MRHNYKNNHLGRKKAHRGAMLSNMASSLIMHKRIFTTVPKAKALRQFVEPLITKSKEDTTHSRRVVFSVLKNKYAVTELFQTVSQKVGDRPGGYTRIIKTGYRLGDNAPMCFIELVDFDENMLKEVGPKKARTRRSRRKSSDKVAGAETRSAASDVKEEAKVEKTEKAKGKTAAKSTKEAKSENEGAKTEAVKEAKNEAPEVKTDTETSVEEAPQSEPVSSEEEKGEKEEKRSQAEADEDIKS